MMRGKGSNTMGKILKSYFFWTHARGTLHYDVMVSLILAFIFLTPRVWNFGDKPIPISGFSGPIVVVSDHGRGLLVTVGASDVHVAANADDAVVRKALHRAIEPVTGDAVFVMRWETVNGPDGQPMEWRVHVRR